MGPTLPRARSTARVLFVALVACSAAAETAPTLPWTSFRAIAEEHPLREIYRCSQEDGRTQIIAILIQHPPGFYRLWAKLRGSDWVAIRYDAEARPDWVWRGTWSGDELRVASVSAFDPAAHASACDLLFRTLPRETDRTTRPTH